MKKLTLNRDTIRLLANIQLGNAVGGITGTRCAPTEGCATRGEQCYSILTGGCIPCTSWPPPP